MEISFFATKCRYCGEGVGRPREEARQLTVHDLGAPEPSEFTVASSVTEALEAFRVEEMERLKGHEDIPHHSWFHRDKQEPKPEERAPSVRTTETTGLAVEHLGFSKPPTTVRRPQSLWTRKLALFSVFVSAAVIIYFGGGFVKARIDDYLASGNPVEQVVVENKAVRILQEGGPGLEALKEALATLAVVNDLGNREVADQARARIREEVEALLDAENWTQDKLDLASRLANSAVELDPSSTALQALKKEVHAEVCAYRMTIEKISAESGKVTLRVISPHEDAGVISEHIVYGKDETVKGRFRIKSIMSDYIRMEDMKRKGSGGLPRQIGLYPDGTIRTL